MHMTVVPRGIDPAHEQGREGEEQADTSSHFAKSGIACPFAAHDREHNARAERGRADNGHDLKITCDRNDLIDGALDKVLLMSRR